MSAHDEAVEAAARVFHDTPLGRSPAETQIEATKDAIAVYLRHMRAAGFVVSKVPERRGYIRATFDTGPLPSQRYLDGWNCCRAEMLANAVEVSE